VTRHVLPGLRPEPLGSYLAGLGLVRLIGEQADSQVTAAWTADGFVIDSTVDDIPAWLVDTYQPTPIVSPWNEGSGFGAKDKTPKQALDTLILSLSPRLDLFRTAVATARQVGEASRTNGWTKERTVRELRNRCPDALLPWIDAAVILTSQQAYFPPLLGTGGNDGRLDFSTNFHQRLLEVLDEAPKTHQRSLGYARDLITGVQSERLQVAPVGQFDPGAAGGRNSSPFGGADSLVNPWAYVLLVEGALLFASSAVRRHQHAAGRAAMPFTVIASPDGSGSGAQEESRGEVWTPVWVQPFTLPEIRQLFVDARASWNGRPAQRAVDFYAATRTLGVARGVDSFMRYGLHRRNGLAFVAVPIERVDVTEKPEVRLVARLEEWVSWVRRGESSTAVGRAVRRFDTAHVAFVRAGGPEKLAGVLAALTDLEQAVGRSGGARENVPVRTPLSAHPFLSWLSEARVQAECAELRVAVGIASCASRSGRDEDRNPARSMRELLLPVDPRRPGDRQARWRDAPVVAGFGLRPLRQVLADVLVWRSRTASDERDAHASRSETSFHGAPTFRDGIPVPSGDLQAFATGTLDDEALGRWLRACLALRWDDVRHSWGAADKPALLVPTLGLLHWLAEGMAPEHAEVGAPRLALNPDWATRLAAGQLVAVHGEAVRRLRQAGWRAVPSPYASSVEGDAVRGTAVAAALVPRCDGSRKQLRHFAMKIPKLTEETS